MASRKVKKLECHTVVRLWAPTLPAHALAILVLEASYSSSGRLSRRQADWKRLLAYITESVDQELLLRNEYLVTENRLLRQQIRGHVRLNDSDRTILATIGKKLGKQALEEIATIAKPDTILAWHRQLIARKFDGSQQRKPVGRWEPEDLCRERLGGLLKYYYREAA
jgi:hypothetical protein